MALQMQRRRRRRRIRRRKEEDSMSVELASALEDTEKVLKALLESDKVRPVSERNVAKENEKKDSLEEVLYWFSCIFINYKS